MKRALLILLVTSLILMLGCSKELDEKTIMNDVRFLFNEDEISSIDILDIKSEEKQSTVEIRIEINPDEGISKSSRIYLNYYLSDGEWKYENINYDDLSWEYVPTKSITELSKSESTILQLIREYNADGVFKMLDDSDSQVKLNSKFIYKVTILDNMSESRLAEGWGEDNVKNGMVSLNPVAWDNNGIVMETDHSNISNIKREIIETELIYKDDLFQGRGFVFMNLIFEDQGWKLESFYEVPSVKTNQILFKGTTSPTIQISENEVKKLIEKERIIHIMNEQEYEKFSDQEMTNSEYRNTAQLNLNLCSFSSMYVWDIKFISLTEAIIKMDLEFEDKGIGFYTVSYDKDDTETNLKIVYENHEWKFENLEEANWHYTPIKHYERNKYYNEDRYFSFINDIDIPLSMEQAPPAEY